MTVEETTWGIEGFEDNLALAEENAKPGFEQKFVEDLRAKFDRFRGGMFITDKQLSLIKRIGGAA